MINKAVQTFRKMGRGVYEKISFTGQKSVTFEKEPVRPTPIVKDYSPSEKKVEVKTRTTEQILASLNHTVEEIKDNQNQLVPLSNEQALARFKTLSNKTLKKNMADKAINQRATEVNKHYALTDSAIKVYQDTWYAILKPSTEDTYYLRYSNGKAYIVQHLGTIKYLVISAATPFGLQGTEIIEHMNFSRFESIVQNSPNIKTLARVYKFQSIYNKDNDLDTDWNNNVPVFSDNNDK